MARLFIVAGASGAGKSFLLQTATNLVPAIAPIRKLTTRSPREFESSAVRDALDLDFGHGERTVRSCDFFYIYGEDWYGIRVEDIESAFDSGRHPMVIVRNADAIRRLKARYPDAVVLWLQSGLSGGDLESRLRAQGRPDIEISSRMARTDWDFHEYVVLLRDRLVDYVIVNHFDPDKLVEQLQSILIHELESPEVDPYLVFVLMAFDPKLDEVYQAIKTAGELVHSVPLRVARIDDAGLVDYRITDEILAFIRRAGVIVCDLSLERPNVYYELGFARGIGKRVVSCAQSGTELHFDIKDFNTIMYHSAFDLQHRLKDTFERLYRLRK